MTQSSMRYSRQPFPPYRYVPGRSPHPTRDPQGHSFLLSVSPRALSPETWRTCEQYLYAIDLFNHGYWWEAHEALEPFWRAAGRDSEAGRFLQGVIQLAAALLKDSMGLERPARRLATAACVKLLDTPKEMFGIDPAALVARSQCFFGEKSRTAPQVVLKWGASLSRW